MSAKAAARKASKRARREQEVILGPAVAAGTGVRRGPPVAPSSGLLSGSVVNDEWQTVRRSWSQVAEVFAGYRSKRVWMPFYYDGKCADHLHSLGFENVVHRQEDFFERVLDKKFLKTIDLIWDNPPVRPAPYQSHALSRPSVQHLCEQHIPESAHSITSRAPQYTSAETKEKVLRALAASGLPFAMLLPISVLHVAFVREILDMSQVQVIIPRRVHVCKTGREEVPFKYLCWFCYRTQLPRDVVFIGDEEGAATEHDEDGLED